MSSLEDKFAWQINALGLPEPEREYRFCPSRRWRFDFAWPDNYLIAAEVEGGIWTHGRHTRGSGFERDCEKYDEATLLGWRVFKFTSGMIRSGYAIRTIERAIKAAQEIANASS